MSLHLKTRYNTPAVQAGLLDHGLDINKPSMASDCFRLGWIAAQERFDVVGMIEAMANLENDDGAIPSHAWDMIQKSLSKARQCFPPKKKSPLKCYAGHDLHEGDKIMHPDTSIATVTYDEDFSNKWRAVYSNGDNLWLANQVGDKGRAEKI